MSTKKLLYLSESKLPNMAKNPKKGSKMTFITTLKEIKDPIETENGKIGPLEQYETIEVPQKTAETLLDGGRFVKRAWQCLRCGTIHKTERKPVVCENPNCSKKGPFKPIHPEEPHEIGNALIKNRNFATITESLTETKPGLVHMYGGGIYDKERAKGEIRQLVKQMTNDESTQRLEKKVIDHIATKCQFPEQEFGVDGQEAVTKNGILELDNLELEPHNPDKLALTKIDTEFDPEAESPRFKELLKTMIPREKDRTRLKELSGTALTDSKKHKKALVIVGPTDAGKSTLLSIIAGVFGEENVSRKTLKGLADTRWDRIALRFSKINISDEMCTGKIRRTDRVKKIIAGSKISAEDKGTSAINIHPTAEHIYATNQTPYARRGDDAFWNRFIVIETPNEIPKEDQIKKLDKKILEEEAPGILNWIIEGYKQFEKNGEEFTYGQDWPTARDRWLEWGDSVQRFIEQFVYHDEGKKIRTGVLYDVYLAWAQNNERLEAQSQNALTKRIKQTVPYAKYSRNYRFNGEKDRGFKNINVDVEQMEAEITISQCISREEEDEEEGGKTYGKMSKTASKRAKEVLPLIKSVGRLPGEIGEKIGLPKEEVSEALGELYDAGLVKKSGEVIGEDDKLWRATKEGKKYVEGGF